MLPLILLRVFSFTWTPPILLTTHEASLTEFRIYIHLFTTNFFVKTECFESLNQNQGDLARFMVSSRLSDLFIILCQFSDVDKDSDTLICVLSIIVQSFIIFMLLHRIQSYMYKLQIYPSHLLDVWTTCHFKNICFILNTIWC